MIIFKIIALLGGLAWGQIPLTTSTTHHTNQVTIRGTSQPQKIKAMVDYYLDYWQLDSLHLLVEYSNNLPRPLKGYTQYVEDKKWGVKQAIIRINARLSPKEQGLTIAHEMVHVKQFRRGELQWVGKTGYRWKNHSYRAIAKKAYHTRAWEQEAFRLEKKLYLLYLKEE
ncbi:ImmA/IrrE family metallo-endopeptidase [uncultured Microscilla sp.]|uniref:ImmA/IrrE family metallo-endopeptidase n=1 Tax=uncultured Microscilla sp. TaxID=432653 RepID=UPI002630D580|nr:ImmA/IrrE family metallo-endopeptidase [uncultured Microscilla sp.]